MLISHTENFILNINEFMEYFPFCGFQNFPVRCDEERSYLIELDSESDFTFLDIITWFLNDYTNRKPIRIEFDYYLDHTNITAVFHDCEVSFTFFDYE